MEMESLRLRLEFGNPDILTSAQKSRGLEKTWIFVEQPNTKFTTLAALSAHIFQTFHLNHSCPHGILLSMDGFTLQSFVPISILKDNDVISVQKIEPPSVEGSEEIEKESGGYEIEEFDVKSEKEHEEYNLEAIDPLGDGNNMSKQRKASQKFYASKKMKQEIVPLETAANIEIPHENKVPSGKKSNSKKGKSSTTGNQTTGGANGRRRHNEKNKKVDESASKIKIIGQFQEKSEDDGSTNVSGLSQWQNESIDQLEIELIDQLRNESPDQLQNRGLDQPKGLLHWKQFGGKDISKAWSKPEDVNLKHKTHANLDCNDKCTDLVVKGNGGPNQNDSAHAPSTPGDLEQIIQDKEEVDDEESDGEDVAAQISQFDAAGYNGGIQVTKKRKRLTDEQEDIVYCSLLRSSVNGKLKKYATTEVAKLFNLHIRQVQRIWKKKKEIPLGEVRKKLKCGRKRIHVDVNRIPEIPLKQRTTLGSLANALGVSYTTLFRRFKEGQLEKMD